MKRSSLVAGILFLFLSVPPLPAQVPKLINFQGRVAVGGVNFDGSGHFKFALVDGAGLTHWSNDGTSAAGSEPVAAVSLTVSKGHYSVLLGDDSVPNMIALPPSVFTDENPDIAPGIFLRVWFDDGTSGSQQLTPDRRIAAVAYAIVAGTVPDGSITSAKLAPGAAAANLADSGLAGVPGGSVVILESEDPALIAAGYQQFGSIPVSDYGWEGRLSSSAPSTWRQGHTTTWTGNDMIVWGGRDELLSGLVPGGERYRQPQNDWMPTGSGGLAAREGHSAVWTGSEMIVWGGESNAGGLTYFDDGSRFNPSTGSWTPVTAVGAPSARAGHTAVWTGSEMVVWGGTAESIGRSDVERYDPATGTWTGVAGAGAPPGDAGYVAVWMNGEMFVWHLGTVAGGRFDPVANSWAPVASAGAPAPRQGATVLWTGAEVIVWGGNDPGSGVALNDGARYNPVTDTWAPVTVTDAPLGRAFHSAVWTGTEMIVWGGWRSTQPGAVPQLLSDGARYDPLNDEWQPLATEGLGPAGRGGHFALWTGSEMLVWGGYDLENFLADGARYDPAQENWVAITSLGAPSPITFLPTTALWSGSEMILLNKDNPVPSPWRYNPAADQWAQGSSTGAPVGLVGRTAVWTGTEVLVWGVNGLPVSGNGGARYNPATDSWTATPANPAASARFDHVAVWTGTEMLVWGGWSHGTRDDGARYDPAADAWTPISTASAPVPRFAHTAVWSGSEMIVWGGSGDSFARDGERFDLFGGGRYEPASDSWQSVGWPSNGDPRAHARRDHRAAWTGSEMLIWGGSGAGSSRGLDRYDPATDTWNASNTEVQGPPTVWTGSEMPIWGSAAVSGNIRRPNPLMSAVWTGSELFFWGGNGYDSQGAPNGTDVWTYTPGRTQLFLYRRP